MTPGNTQYEENSSGSELVWSESETPPRPKKFAPALSSEESSMNDWSQTETESETESELSEEEYDGQSDDSIVCSSEDDELWAGVEDPDWSPV